MEGVKEGKEGKEDEENDEEAGRTNEKMSGKRRNMKNEEKI